MSSPKAFLYASCCYPMGRRTRTKSCLSASCHSHCRSPCPAPHDGQAFFEWTGNRRTYHAGASGALRTWNRFMCWYREKGGPCHAWYLKAGKNSTGSWRKAKKETLRKAINDEKALQHQLKKQLPERNGRTGSVLVAVCWKVFCKSRNAWQMIDVMLLLKLIFHRQDTQELLKNCWNGRSGNPLVY